MREKFGQQNKIIDLNKTVLAFSAYKMVMSLYISPLKRMKQQPGLLNLLPLIWSVTHFCRDKLFYSTHFVSFRFLSDKILPFY